MNSPHAGRALDVIRGDAEAQKVVDRIRRGLAAPDELLEAIRGAFSLGNAAVLEGFFSGLRKALERQ